MLEGLLLSVERHSVHPVEVLAVCDRDDLATVHAIPRLCERFRFLSVLTRDRSGNLNHDYLNFAAARSTGKYVLVLNDDTAIATPRWDDIASVQIEEYLRDKPDRCCIALPQDGLATDYRNRQGCGQYGSFPIVTREAINAVGWTMPPAFPSWGADISIFQIYNRVGRVLQLPDVVINHFTVHNGSRARDETSHHVERLARGGWHPLSATPDTEPAYQALQQAINRVNTC